MKISSKKLYSLAILAAALVSQRVAAKSEHRDNRKNKEVVDHQLVQKACNGCVTGFITQKDFDCNGSVTITQPGIWRLAENINFAPTITGTAAIQILSNNVTLDLCGFTLQQVNTIASGIGVRIGTSDLPTTFTNITVKNGTITRFSTVGILVEKGSQILSFLNLATIKNGGNGGITPVAKIYATPISGGLFFFGTSTDPIKDVIIDNLNASDNNSGVQADINSAGMILSWVERMSVTASHFDGNTSARAATGCHYFPIADVTFDGCSFNGTLGVAGAHGLGINGGFSAGLVPPIIRNKRLIIKNCEAKNITCTASNAFQAAGIEVEDGEGAVISNCVVQNINNMATQRVSGFPEGGTSTANGFTIANVASFYVIENCSVMNVATNGASATAFSLAQSPSNFVVRNCAVINIFNGNTEPGAGASSNGINLNLVAGFVDPTKFGIGNLFENCVVEGVTATSVLGAGIALAGQTNAMVRNCTFNRNGRGILVTASLGVSTTNSLFENNTVMANANEGIAEVGNPLPVSGIPNTYTANQALFNGTNYAALAPGTPIRLWPAGASPASLTTDGNPATDLDNISRS